MSTTQLRRRTSHLKGTTMPHQLRSVITRRPRATLAAVGVISTLLIAGPAAAGCTPLDELPTVPVPTAPGVSLRGTVP